MSTRGADLTLSDWMALSDEIRSGDVLNVYHRNMGLWHVHFADGRHWSIRPTFIDSATIILPDAAGDRRWHRVTFPTHEIPAAQDKIAETGLAHMRASIKRRWRALGRPVSPGFPSSATPVYAKP